MTNEQIIRKAVELADKWHWTADDRVYAPHLCFKTPLNDLALDALAAQLVRQLHEAGKHNELFHIRWQEGKYAPYTVVRGLRSPIMSMTEELSRVDGEDTPENRIKAIVDSGVPE